MIGGKWLLLLLVAFIVSLEGVLAYPPGWGNDTRLTFSTGDSIQPSIATDGGGNIHVAWVDDRNGPSFPFYMKLNNNGTKDPRLGDRVIGDHPNAHAFNPAIDVDTTNIAHVAYNRLEGRDEIILQRVNTDNGALFPGLNFLTGTGLNPDVAVDRPRNYAYVVWDDYRDNGRYDLYYSKYNIDGGIYFNNRRLTSTPTHSSRYPSIAVDQQGNLYVVWQEFEGSFSRLYYDKVDIAGNVVINISLTSENHNAIDPSIAVDQQGNMYVVWVDDRDSNLEIYYKKLDFYGNIVVDETRLTYNNAASSEPAVAVDSLNRLHIAWRDYRDGNDEIYYKKVIGTRLTQDIRLTYDVSNSSQPSIAVDSQNNAHVVFVDYRDYNAELYYKRGGTNIPPDLASIQPASIFENQTLNIQLQAQDPDNDTLIFSTNADSVLPSYFSFNETTGLFIWTPTFRDAGVYNVTFGASDGIEIDIENATITVYNINVPPLFFPLADRVTTEGQSVSFKANATDFDNDLLTYSTNSAEILPSAFKFNTSTGEFQWMTTYTDYGNYTLTFSASDGEYTVNTSMNLYVRDAQLSNLLIVGAPRLGNTVQLILADRTAVNQPYVLVLSTATDPPLALGDGRNLGLTPNTVFLVSLYLPTLIGLRDSVGMFNNAGNAIATWTVPNVPELANTTVYFGFVSLDTVQPGTRTIISISPVTSTTVIS